MATKKDQQTEQLEERVTVTLKAYHTHAGKKCMPGDTIAVWPRQVERLRKQGIIE